MRTCREKKVFPSDNVFFYIDIQNTKKNITLKNIKTILNKYYTYAYPFDNNSNDLTYKYKNITNFVSEDNLFK